MAKTYAIANLNMLRNHQSSLPWVSPPFGKRKARLFDTLGDIGGG
jgi:hypothetical protein